MNQILGSMRRVDEHRGAVRVEDVYNTDIDDLWSAVTDPDRLRRWIATVEGDLKVGGIVQTLFTSTWAGPGRIDVCDPPHHLVVTMEPGTDDEAVIEAVLTAEGEQTRLVVEECGLPLDVLYRHGAGWQAHIVGSRVLPGWRPIELEGALDGTHSDVPVARPVMSVSSPRQRRWCGRCGAVLDALQTEVARGIHE